MGVALQESKHFRRGRRERKNMSPCKTCGSDVELESAEEARSKDYLSPRTFHEALALSMENTTIHGLGHIWNNRRNLLAVFWILVFGICTFSATFASDTYLRDFFARKIHSQSEIRWSTSLPMPSLTMCSKGFFSKRKLEALNVDPKAYNLMMGLISPLFAMNVKKLSSQDMRVPLEEAYANITGIMEKNNFTFKRLIQEVSYSCEELIAGCTANRRFYPGARCCNHVLSIPSLLGLCHIYYAGQGIVQGINGDITGLTFYVRVPQNDTPVLLKDFVRRSVMMKKGIQVTPMSNVTHPSVTVVEGGVMLSPSFITSLKVSAVVKDREGQKVSYLDYKTEPCIPSSELNYREDRAKFKNAGPNCYLLAFERCTKDFCNCSLYGSDPDSDTQYCNPLETVRCMLVVDGYDKTKGKQFGECFGSVMSHCRVICRETTFTFGVSHSYYDELHVDEEMENITTENNLALLNVHYGSFDFNYIKYWREGSSELLSKQGGQMGLFLGCSLISLIEVVVFFFVFVVSLGRTLYGKFRRCNSTVEPVDSKWMQRMKIQGIDGN